MKKIRAAIGSVVVDGVVVSGAPVSSGSFTGSEAVLVDAVLDSATGVPTLMTLVTVVVVVVVVVITVVASPSACLALPTVIALKILLSGKGKAS